MINAYSQNLFAAPTAEGGLPIADSVGFVVGALASLSGQGQSGATVRIISVEPNLVMVAPLIATDLTIYTTDIYSYLLQPAQEI